SKDRGKRPIHRPTFNKGVLDLRTLHGKAAMPALFLNATSVETGRRSIASRVQPAHPGERTFLDADDTLDILKSDVSLAAAIHNSARFTYVSPAGHLESYDGQEHGHVVDGGYFENSGLATLQEVHDAIMSQPIAGMSIRPLVVYLCNDPKP